MLGLEAARRLILRAAHALGRERIAVSAARGRVLARPVRSQLDLPGFDQSAVDGYALGSVARTNFTLIGRAEAGRPFGGRLRKAAAIRILTGAPVPPGTAAVVMQERTRAAGSIVLVEATVAGGANIRRRGEDVRKGQAVLPAGTVVGPREIGLLGALGEGAVTVFRRPTVSILATGTELRRAGDRLPPGGLYDANGPLVEALVAETGAVATKSRIVRDDEASLIRAIKNGLHSDVLILCGGVSVGDKDLVRAAAKQCGVKEIFWRVNIKPGMPLYFGRRGKTLVFGLPGNPVSVYVTFREFVMPALDRLAGRPWRDGFTDRVTLTEPLQPSRHRRVHFVRVRRDPAGSANNLVRPLSGQGSHQIHSLVRADGWVRVESRPGGWPKGAAVAARMEPPC